MKREELDTITAREPERDLSTTRVYKLGFNTIFIQREDPFGYWFIHYEKGQVPERLRSAFTSASVAEGVLMNYLEQKNKTIAGVETHKVKEKII